ncbi:MAG: hypothetical protein E5V36_21390, partial [Mesorhizobium sp.]
MPTPIPYLAMRHSAGTNSPNTDPQFFKTDVLISINKAKWDTLSPEAQKLLADTAVEYERASYDANLAESEKQAQAMIDGGQKVV